MRNRRRNVPETLFKGKFLNIEKSKVLKGGGETKAPAKVLVFDVAH